MKNLPGIGTTASAWTLSDTAGVSVSLSDLNGRGVVFMEINTTDDRAKAPECVRRRGFNYGFAFNGRSVADEYRVSASPTMFVIGRDGTIRFVHEGDTDDLEKILAEAIEKEMQWHPWSPLCGSV